MDKEQVTVTNGTSRVKSYGQLEQEIRSLEEQVAFYQTELEDAVRSERHRACLILRQFLNETLADELCDNIMEDD